MAERRSWFRRAPRQPEPELAGMALPPQPPQPTRARKSTRKTYSVTDAVLVGIGIGLTAACATFPWYVFMNQDKFGYAEIAFDDNPIVSDTSGPFYTPRVQWKPAPATPEDVAALPLDYVATGTVVGSIDRDGPVAGEEAQPFPETPVRFELVHVANGRAMIRDDNGLFVVERGSVLPDNSRVVSIEDQAGKWVLKTSRDQVVELSR
jgi:hypothetical protein